MEFVELVRQLGASWDSVLRAREAKDKVADAIAERIALWHKALEEFLADNPGLLKALRRNKKQKYVATRSETEQSVISYLENGIPYGSEATILRVLNVYKELEDVARSDGIRPPSGVHDVEGSGGGVVGDGRSLAGCADFRPIQERAMA